MSSEKERLTTPEQTPEDKALDLKLRPTSWQGFIGQKRIKKNLKILIKASQKRGEACPEHILFYGNSGLGKTTLAYIIANRIQNNIRTISGTTIKRVGDLAAILTNLGAGEVLFIDEIHRINKMVEEFLYPAMEDYKLHLILGRGPMAKTMDIDLPRFTLVGATTKIGLLSAPLRNRFGATFQLNYYNKEEIGRIVNRSAKILNIETKGEAVEKIAKRSRFTPRVANRLLKRVRDWAQVEGEGIINKEAVDKACRYLGIDEKGLEQADRRVLETIIEKFEGGPAGLQAICAASSEEKRAMLDIYEPYLMRIGFIKRTPKGRVVTKHAYQHLDIKEAGGQKELFDNKE